MIAPVDHKKLYVPAGVIVRLMDPFGMSQELLSTGTDAIEKVLLVFEIVNVSEMKHPFEPVIVILYVPAGIFTRSSAIDPFDQI